MSDPTERLNRMARDLFWWRWGRDLDWTGELGDPVDPDDYARYEEILDWLSRCCPLPRESRPAYMARVQMLRGLRELTEAEA